jgi:hypothetical protein
MVELVGPETVLVKNESNGISRGSGGSGGHTGNNGGE